jgi:hypothetical protein
MTFDVRSTGQQTCHSLFVNSQSPDETPERDLILMANLDQMESLGRIEKVPKLRL